MNIYKVMFDSTVEAKNASQAADIHSEGNSESAKIWYYESEQEARSKYESICKALRAPKALSRGLFWFEVVSIETAEGCETEEGGTLEDAFLTGTWPGMDIEVGKESF